jgi:hypothetical protein
MPEIIGVLLWTDRRHERANCSIEPGDGALSEFAQVGFERAVNHLDRIKVGRILRQIAKRRPRARNRLSYPSDFVGAKIVHHHDVVALERWQEALFDVGKEHFSGHRPVNYHRRYHFVVTKRRHESDGLPGPLRHTINHPHATWSSAIQPHHVGADRRLINKDQVGGVKQPLLSDPAPTCLSHVRSLLFGCPQAFF